MNWGSPLWLFALIGVLVLTGVVVLSGFLHRRKLAGAFGGDFLYRILPLGVRVRRTLRDVLGLMALAAAVIALAEPRFDKEIRTITTKGTDLVLCVDLSRSMDAKDVDPSRLERARREIADLSKILTGDRVGLVLYAGGAYPRMPLTEDYKAIELVLRESDTATFEAQGSELGDAIRVASKLLENSQQQAGQAIVVFSDGETHRSDDALAAAKEAAAKDIAVYTVGIGSEPSPIPLPNGKWLKRGSETVLTTPDDSTLKEVARISGGAYVKSVASATDMQQLYQNAIRTNIRAVERDAQQREVWKSAYQWPLGFAVLALIFGSWLGDGKRLFGAAASLLLAFSLLRPAPAMASSLADADALYRAGKFVEAADQLTELSLEQPTDPSIYDRLGAARYRGADYEGAARAFEQASRLRGGGDPDSLFGAGNAHYLAGRLEQALERYDEILASNPDHPGAAANKDMLMKELEARRLIQPPPPPPPEPSEGDDEEQDPSEQQDQEQQQQQQEQSDSEEGDPEDSEEQQQEPQDQEGDPGEEQETEGEAEEQDSEGSPDEQLEESGPITEGEAHRLLDGVKEGSQKVHIKGPPGGNPW